MSIDKIIAKFKFMNILVDKISTQSKVCLIVSLLILASLFMIQSLIVFRVYEPSYNLALIDYICVVIFMIPFSIFIRDFLLSVKNNEKDLTISSVAEFDDESNVVDFLEYLKMKRDKELN